MSFPRIWIMSGGRSGDDGQARALAEEVGLPFETRRLAYNWRSMLGGRSLGASVASVTDEVRDKTLVPPWPDLIILVGKRTVPVARWVQEQNAGRTRLVLIGRARCEAERFDLVYATRQYPLSKAPSVRLQPVAMSRYRRPAKATAEEAAWLDSLPRPHFLMMIGGATRHWRMRPGHVAAAAAKLAEKAHDQGGSLIVARSARTGDEVMDAVEDRLEGAACEWRAVRHEFPRFPVLLQDADVLFPTADSISMISESIVTQKPVGIVPAEMSWRGWFELGSERNINSNPRRDLRRFWNYLFENQIAGTMERPIASKTANPVIAAAAEVRELLERSFGKLPA